MGDHFLAWTNAFIFAYVFRLIGDEAIVAKHYILRLVLWLKGDIPRDYMRFLDYAAARVFLREVGGYIFVHQLVKEHFAG